jgi:hypothetical protein
MAVTKVTSTLGEITTNFLLNDFDVFLMNTSATGGYVSTDWSIMGYTDPEKTMTRVNEKFTKEAKIPRVPIYQKTIRKGLELQFSLCNINEDLISIFSQGNKSSLGATGTRIAHGTSEASVEYRYLRFATTRDDGKHYVIDIPKAEITLGEQTFGGEENVVIPMTARAFYNPTASATANVYVELMLTAGINATAVTDTVGY